MLSSSLFSVSHGYREGYTLAYHVRIHLSYIRARDRLPTKIAHVILHNDPNQESTQLAAAFART